MACGVPVVASNADGSREAVREGELGVIVDPADPTEIKAGILKALKNSAKIIPSGLDHFSFSNFTMRLHNAIEQLTNYAST
jgi:glycosyltransferase involved in cell wall biosynthesis